MILITFGSTYKTPRKIKGVTAEHPASTGVHLANGRTSFLMHTFLVLSYAQTAKSTGVITVGKASAWKSLDAKRVPEN